MTGRFTALLLLATLVTFGPPAPAGAQPVGDVFRKVSPAVVVIRSKGRDVSAYDGPVDWRTYDFGINKRTEGSSYVSPGAIARRTAIRAAGKVYGEYHYAQPGDGARQADFLLAVAGMPADGDLPATLDYEVPGLGAAFRDAFCRRYIQRVGVAPTLYTYLAMWRGELRSQLGAAGRLWLAQYGVNAPAVPCAIWQHQGGPDLDTAYTALSSMTIGAIRKPPVVITGPPGVYPYGPDGRRPMTSVIHETYSGETWQIFCDRYFRSQANPGALKKWHLDHGGDTRAAGWATFGVGMRIVFPSGSPGFLR